MVSSSNIHMKYVTLNNGAPLPVIGLGTWQSKPNEVKGAVKAAIACGYRHIDCAAVYGNEAEVGQALQECMQEGLCQRNDLFVTSKLWSDSKEKEHVIPALRESLRKLQLDYLDMYMIHSPVSLKRTAKLGNLNKESFLTEEEAPLSETWKEMERAVELGLTKGIGVSNFSPKKIKSLLEVAKIPPAINQVERHPLGQRKEIMSFCQEHGIHVTSYSPLGSGSRPIPVRGNAKLLELEEVVSIAQKHGCTPAQVVLRWNIQTGSSVIPKSVNPERLQENLAALQVKLDDEDMEKLNSLDHSFRYFDGSSLCIEGSPYTLDTLWDGA